MNLCLIFLLGFRGLAITTLKKWVGTWMSLGNVPGKKNDILIANNIMNNIFFVIIIVTINIIITVVIIILYVIISIVTSIVIVMFRMVNEGYRNDIRMINKQKVNLSLWNNSKILSFNKWKIPTDQFFWIFLLVSTCVHKCVHTYVPIDLLMYTHSPIKKEGA